MDISSADFRTTRTNFFSTHRYAVALFLIGMLVTIGIRIITLNTNAERIDGAINEKFNQLYEKVNERFSLYQYGIREARTAILSGGGENVTRQEMNQFGSTLDLKQYFPGARGFGFVRWVKREAIDAFLKQAKADGAPNFSVSQYSPNFGDYYIVQYIEPEFYLMNEKAIGFDIASEPRRRKTADAAMRSGKAQMTPPIQLVTHDGGLSDSLLVLLPLYRGGSVPDTEEKRLKAGFGWINAPLSLSDVLKDIVSEPDKLIFTITDITDNSQASPFYRNSLEQGLYPHERPFNLLGREWKFSLTVTPKFLSTLHLHSAFEVFSTGFSVSLLLSLLVGMFNVQRRNRFRLIHEQTKLHAIVESSVDGIIGKNLDGVVISWNTGAETIFGYTREEAIGKPLKELLIPERLWYEESDILAKIARGETISGFETIRHRKDGTEFPVSATVSPILSSSGEVLGAAKTVRDISAQKAAEAKIHELNANLEQQVELRTEQLNDLNILFSNVLSAASEVAIIAVEPNGLIKVFNTGAENMLGYRSDEMVDKQLPTVFHDEEEIKERSLELSKEYGQAVNGMDVFTLKARLNMYESLEWTYIRKDGSRIPVNLVVTVIRGNHDEITGYLGIARDISEQKSAEKELRDAKVAADEANAAKSMFLANMSHEIRTPMNAVLGMLQLLLKTTLNQKQYEFASKARIAATSLLTLLNDILDYSKIESGKLDIDPHPFDLEGMMEHLAVVMSGNIQDKNIELLFDLDEQVPSFLIGDELRIQQVLLNLISNAIKFTEEGEVVVRSRLLSLRDNQVRIVIQVVDTGIGISPEQQKRIFDGFTQAEASITRRYGGTGLGLVISRHLIELMGGELLVDSELDKGSSFFFELTFPIDTSQPWQPQYFENQPRILVVDDNDVALTMVEDNLTRLHARVTTAMSGVEAIRSIEQADQEGDPYECLVLDWLMPHMDGVELAYHIRDKLELTKQPKIVLISAANHGDIPIVDESSPFEVTLSKPVTSIQLFTAVNNAMRNRRSNNTDLIAPQQDAASPLRGVNVLLVEDNIFNQDVALELLNSVGANVTLAQDGLQGVNAVLMSESDFDVVLMDMQMPNMDGLTATRKIREHDKFAGLPIIAMTANVSDEDKAACLQAGMNAHLGKPLDFQLVVETILTWIGHQPRMTTQVENTPSPQGKLQRVLQRFGGNELLYRKLLHSFLPSFSELNKGLSEAINSHQWSEVIAILHTMKGSAGTAGLDELYHWLKDKEAELKNSDSARQGSEIMKNCVETIALKMNTEYQAMLESLGSSDQEDIQAVASSDINEKEVWFELENCLATANMKALELAESLQANHPNSQSHQALLQAVENLEFESARQWLTQIREEHVT